MKNFQIFEEFMHEAPAETLPKLFIPCFKIRIRGRP